MVVIMALLAAMAIPAAQKVRASVIHKNLQQGKKVSPESRKFYIQYVKAHPEQFPKKK